MAFGGLPKDVLLRESQGRTGRWVDWHKDYDDPASSLSRRLVVVQTAIRRALPERLPSTYRIVSMCAGDGRDLLGVLAERSDVAATPVRLLENDSEIAARARRRAEGLRLQAVQVSETDAGELSAYEGIVPADLVLACGVFGNISEDDIFQTVRCLPQLCRTGAIVIWTRGRAHDLTSAIRQAFERTGFRELDFVAPSDVQFSVGVERFAGQPEPLRPKERMFVFA